MEEEEEEEKLRWSDPTVIMSLIDAGLSDIVGVVAVILLVFPIIGLFSFPLAIFFHYFAGIISWFLIRSKLKHFLPKLILLIFIIVPIPILLIGILIAVAAQNRIIEFIITQVPIQAVAVVTAGAGEALEGAAVATEAGEIAEAAAVAGSEVATTGTEVAEATLETGESAAAGMAEKTGISEAEAAEEKTKKAIEEGWERIKEREEEKENEQKNRENEGSDSAPSEEVATKNPPITNQAQRINNGTVIDLRARKGGGIDNDKKEDSDQLAA